MLRQPWILLFQRDHRLRGRGKQILIDCAQFPIVPHEGTLGVVPARFLWRVREERRNGDAQHVA